MRLAKGIAIALFVCFAGPVAAQGFQDCKATQQDVIRDVLPRAEELARRASASIADNEIYARWFGTYVPKHAEIVRANFKRIHRAIEREELVFICGQPRSVDCIDTYAFVYTSEHYTVTLCPNFFEMPMMPGGSPSHPDYENGTMAGTIIHEVSHFDVVGGTDDICYSRRDCSALGRRSAEEAARNADTYQYFAEDITFAHWAATDTVQADVPEGLPVKP